MTADILFISYFFRMLMFLINYDFKSLREFLKLKS